MANEWIHPKDLAEKIKEDMISEGLLNPDGSAKYRFVKTGKDPITGIEKIDLVLIEGENEDDNKV